MDASHVHVGALALGCFYSRISTRTFRRALTASLPGQLRGDRECPFSGVTKPVWQCLEEGAGKRCSECGSESNSESKHWPQTAGGNRLKGTPVATSHSPRPTAEPPSPNIFNRQTSYHWHRCLHHTVFTTDYRWLTLPLSASRAAKLSANEQFSVGAQTVVSLLQTTQIKQGVSFIAVSKVYTSTNKSTVVWIETELLFFSPGVDASHVHVGALALGCFYSRISTRTFRRALTASLPGQLRGDRECPFSGVTKPVWQCLEEGAGKRCSECGSESNSESKH